MKVAESGRGWRAEVWNLQRAISHSIDRQILKKFPGDIHLCFNFVESSMLADRYLESEKPYWELIQAAFYSAYKLGTDAERQGIVDDINLQLTARQQFVLVEVLWEGGDGSNRPGWLHHMMHEFWEFNASNEDALKEFSFYLRTSTIIPEDEKEKFIPRQHQKEEIGVFPLTGELRQ